MKTINGYVHSVYTDSDGSMGKLESEYIDLELDGIVSDAHRGYTRTTWAGDKQPKGTKRRNERQWSAVSQEELGLISEAMGLSSNITAGVLGSNICLRGIPKLSSLPKGSILKFPSGVELMVEEYNPPCADMGKKISTLFSKESGVTIPDTAFSKASKISRGIVGTIETPGRISKDDKVAVSIYKHPTWLE
jgi:hypothetical protein